MLSLTQDIGHKLRVYQKRAAGVQIDIRNSELSHRQWQCPITPRANSSAVIAKTAFELFAHNYQWQHPIRSVTVRAINLCSEKETEQMDIFNNAFRVDKREQLENAVENIRDRFGKYAIIPATLCGTNIKMPTDREIELRMPTGMVC